MSRFALCGAWSIAGYRIVLDCPGPVVPRSWTRLFPTHALPGAKASGARPEAPDLRIRAVPEYGWDNADRPHGVHTECAADGALLLAEFDLRGVSGRFEPAGRGLAGVLRLCADSAESVSTALRIGLSLLCEDRPALLVHASAVLRDSRVWLFSGRSGAGKSTIAMRLLDRGVVFSHDMVALAFDPLGDVLAFATPFSDPRTCLEGPGCAPLAGIVFIEQAASTSLERLPALDAAGRLAGQTHSYSRHPDRVQRTLDLMSAIVERNRCYHLRFALDRSLWRLIDDTGAAWSAATGGAV